MNDVFHADCIEKTQIKNDYTNIEIKNLIENNSIDLIVSDPPYGVDFKGIQGDEKDLVLENIPKLFKEWYRILKDDCYIFLFVGVKNIENWIIEGKKYFEFKNIIASRCYNNGSIQQKNNFGFQFQPILVFSKGAGKEFNKVDFIPTSKDWLNDKRNKNPKEFTYAYPNWIDPTISFANVKSNKKNLHTTEKSVKLIKFFIEIATKQQDTVFDPFAGSGSTLLAAKQSSRKYIGIEKDIKYYNIILERLK